MSRADRVADRLDERGLDLLLVTDPTNLRYLTGFTGSNGIAVVGRDVRRFITDFRYVEQAARQVEGFECERAAQELVAALRDGWPEGELRLGFEDQQVPVRRFERLRELIPARVALVAAGGVVEDLRLVKDADEVARIRAAAELADAVYGWLRSGGLVGRTERSSTRCGGWGPTTRASRRSSRAASGARSRTRCRPTRRSSAERS